MDSEKIIEFDARWNLILETIGKVQNFLKTEDPDKQALSADDRMAVYSVIYNMCCQKSDYPYQRRLYSKYREYFEEYIKSQVLPSLGEKHGEFLLREFVKSWSDHKIIMKWMVMFFHYLDRYYVEIRSLPTLREVGITCFQNLVYAEVYEEVRDAVMSLIGRECEGEEIDRELVKNVMDVFVEIDIGDGKMKNYESDFEAEMLNKTAAFYHDKALTWISQLSSSEYLLKAEETLKLEKNRVYNNLHLSSEILEKVQHELLTTYATHLPQKDQSGSKSLFMDEKGQDLSKTYLLFSNLPEDLEAVANKVLQHATDGDLALVSKQKVLRTIRRF